MRISMISQMLLAAHASVCMMSLVHAAASTPSPIPWRPQPKSHIGPHYDEQSAVSDG